MITVSLSLLDHPAIWGMVGGLFPETLKWFSMRETLHIGMPAYAKQPYYWIVTLAMVIAGSLLTVAYNNQEMSRILAINIGASAPLMIKEFTGGFQSIEKGSVD